MGDVAAHILAFRRQYGAPVRIVDWESLGSADVSMYAFEATSGCVFVTDGLREVLGVELSGEDRGPPYPPSPLVPELLRGMAECLATIGLTPHHGHVELVWVSQGHQPVQALLVWDPVAEPGLVLRIVGLTPDERELLELVAVDALVEVLPDLVTDMTRHSALTEAEAQRLVRDHPRVGSERVHAPVVRWELVDGRVRCEISERAAGRVRAWGSRRGALTLVGPAQTVVIRCGEHQIRTDRNTLELTLPADVLSRVILPEVVQVEGLELSCCALGVTPAPMPEEVVAHPPALPGPRLHHYLFSHNLMLAALSTLRLTEPGSSSRLTQGWALVGEWVEAERHSFLPPLARGPVPGTRHQGVVGLGVVRVEQMHGWKVGIAQMPLTVGFSEAYYVATVERAGIRRLLSWEKTEDGRATLGEWWFAEEEEVERVGAGVVGSPHVDAFGAAIDDWLEANPNHPSEDAPVRLRPRRLPLLRTAVMAAGLAWLAWWLLSRFVPL